MSLALVTTRRRIAVTVGPGGVGKTTVAALMGLQAAVQGRRALVLTIDPAMRLAEALGLGQVAPGETRILPASLLAEHGIPARADLAVAMLDTGRSLTSLIQREVSSPEHQARILSHPFFRRLCEDLAGSREYAAMEEIHHLYLRGGYDLLVVDTPPTSHSLDFLQAPDRVLDVLEHDSYRWLMRPALLAGRLGLKVLDFSGGYVVRTLSRFTGLDFLRELATFVDLFSNLMEGFRQRAAAFKAILRSDITSFVLVTTPDPNPAAESLYLQRRLAAREYNPGTVVVNRIAPAPGRLPMEPGWREELAAAIDPPAPGDRLVDAMQEAHAALARLAARDHDRLEELRLTLGARSSLEPVPLLDEDVHDLSGLEQMRRAVFEEGGP